MKRDPSHGRNFWRDGVATGKPYLIQDANREFGKYSKDPFAIRIACATMRHCIYVAPDGEVGSKPMEAGE